MNAQLEQQQIVDSDQIEWRMPSELTPNPRNARRHSETQVADIARSIREFGWVRPIITDEALVILAGHGAHRAATNLATPCKVMRKHGLTEEQKRAYLIVDNRLNEMSTWDDELLKLELSELKTFDFDSLQPAALFANDRKMADALGLTPQGGGAERFARYSAKDIEDAAFAWFRERGFPYKRLALHTMKQEINALATLSGSSLLTSLLGYDVADHFHSHRFDGHADGKKSPVESFGIDKSLRHAIKLQLEQGTLPEGWFGALGLVLSTQACSNFRPAFAKMLYQRYAREGAVVLDTSTGYGGRLVGFMAAFERGQYVGIDPATKTHAANLAMCSELGWSERVRLINQPAEDVDLEAESCDMAFTSPPYFGKEHYNDEETQSRLRYPNFDDWCEGFLRPMLALQHRALKPGATNVVNIADVKIKQRKYPLVDATKRIAAEVGFALVETMQFDLARRYGANQDEEVASEPVLVFRK